MINPAVAYLWMFNCKYQFQKFQMKLWYPVAIWTDSAPFPFLCELQWRQLRKNCRTVDDVKDCIMLSCPKLKLYLWAKPNRRAICLFSSWLSPLQILQCLDFVIALGAYVASEGNAIIIWFSGRTTSSLSEAEASSNLNGCLKYPAMFTALRALI